MDDTCTALPSHQIHRFLNHLNSVKPSIQFTGEIESNGKLLFLDVLLEHEADGSIFTTVYRKLTHTDQYLDFSSHHPFAHKIAVVKILHGRTEAICSLVPHKDNQVRHIRQALNTNGYPMRVVERYSGTTKAASPEGEPEGQRPPYYTSLCPRCLRGSEKDPGSPGCEGHLQAKHHLETAPGQT